MDIQNKKKIIESLKLLSLTLVEQRKCFPEFVDVPFEVLDTFDSAFLLLPELIELRTFDYSVIASLLRLHNLINFTSSNPDFKDLDDEKFGYSNEWNNIRALSAEILKIMEEPVEKPNLDYILSPSWRTSVTCDKVYSSGRPFLPVRSA